MSAVYLEALREKLAAQPSVTEMFGPLYKPCGQITDGGHACPWHRPNGDRLCPDCNPRPVKETT